MKTIVMATDLSARADRALDRALILARENGARLTVLHVIDAALPQPAIDRGEREATETVRAYLAARGGGQDVGVAVAVGVPHREILRHAAEAGADLVVLGARRPGAAGAGFQGSTAWKVLRRSVPPVLLVKDAALKGYGRVAVGFDFSAHAEAALRLAYRFRPEEIAVVHAYHVPYEGFLCGSETHDDVRERCRRELDRAVAAVVVAVRRDFPAAPEPSCRLSHGEALEALAEHCRQHHAELLVIGTHGRTGLAHAVFGSIAEALLRDPPCDVVAVRTVPGATP